MENQSHGFHLLKPKFREKFYHDKELNLCGFVDRIHTDFNGTTTIADYKTSNRYGVGIKDEYELQCGIYALLYERLEKRRADFTSIIFVRFGEEVRTRVTPSQIKAALTTVNEVNAKTKSNKIEDYTKHEGKFCQWCSYNKECSGIKEFEGEQRKKKIMEKVGNSS